jgi:hypothetical protein
MTRHWLTGHAARMRSDLAHNFGIQPTAFGRG